MKINLIKIKMYKISSKFLNCFITILFFTLISCVSFQSNFDKPTLTLSWHERGRALLVLGKDLNLYSRMQPPEASPYSDNALGAIWLGVDFPYDKAIKMILWSRNYFLELRYVALSDLVSSHTNIYDKDLYIGGSTRKALRIGLQPWTEKDFNYLKKITSKEQLHKFIRSHYRKNEIDKNDNV